MSFARDTPLFFAIVILDKKTKDSIILADGMFCFERDPLQANIQELERWIKDYITDEKSSTHQVFIVESKGNLRDLVIEDYPTVLHTVFVDLSVRSMIRVQKSG